MKCQSGNNSEQISDTKINLSIPTTNGICPAGEKAGSSFMSEGIEIDALSFYRRYTEFFDIDSVPEEERKSTAQEVAASILSELKNGSAVRVTDH